ncbi:alpha kinase/elongation factor 2 kinase [Anaeramoeba flamelloides]|uniref:Alpha kinase/elongation factor 2 kinase n=1 Tax=Anaeramoeba flamelloides TaxID=1746091 RepID=A0ABQ8X2X9_9EUKA|nr:alpha kinase/elongation factor 2 kinase [Anaeramoeba flamelloides]
MHYRNLYYDSTINYGNSNNNKKIELLCAIDFGSTRTAAGWTIGVDNIPRNQFITTDGIKIKLDPNDDNFTTPTAILFKKIDQNDWEPISFGKSAEREYFGLRNNEIDNYRFFKNYKMKLYQNNSINPKIRSFSGEEWSIIKVLSGVFKFINQKFIESVNESNSKINLSINNDTTQWVLTVPAIWEDKAKEIMRRAFFQAGLISSQDSANLLFCYEPEAAALVFIQDQRNNLDKLKNKNLLVVDAGRRTIDITLVKPTIVNNEIEKFEILMVPTGGDSGSIYIDQEFIKFFQSFLNLNNNQFNQFKNECPKGFLKLSNQWEGIKIKIFIGDLTEYDSHFLEIPRIILRYLEKRFGIKDFKGLAKKFNQRNQNSGLSEIEWDDDERFLVISGDRIKSFFKKAIQKLRSDLNLFKQTTEILRQTDIVLFTGGLSNSDYFRKSVQKILGNNYQYCKSSYPEKSNLVGSIYFGFDPKIISIKRSQFTMRKN